MQGNYYFAVRGKKEDLEKAAEFEIFKSRNKLEEVKQLKDGEDTTVTVEGYGNISFLFESMQEIMTNIPALEGFAWSDTYMTHNLRTVIYSQPGSCETKNTEAMAELEMLAGPSGFSEVGEIVSEYMEEMENADEEEDEEFYNRPRMFTSEEGEEYDFTKLYQEGLIEEDDDGCYYLCQPGKTDWRFLGNNLDDNIKKAAERFGF